MPFRERLKKTFSRNSSTGASDTSSLSKTNTNGTTLDYRTDPSVYKPNEKMPPPKYRRPVQKEHKEKLEAFNFAKAWRRKSNQSVYSPMGSRAQSRAGSVTSPSRNGSVTTAGAPRKSFHRGGSLDVPPDRLEESKAEASESDSGHFGLMRDSAYGDTIAGASNSGSTTSQRHRSSRSVGRPKSPLVNGIAQDDENFTPAALDQALKKSRLGIP